MSIIITLKGIGETDFSQLMNNPQEVVDNIARILEVPADLITVEFVGPIGDKIRETLDQSKAEVLAMLQEIANEQNLPLEYYQKGASEWGFKGEGWYFWDETQSYAHGPYETYREAAVALRAYGIELEHGPNPKSKNVQSCEDK